MTSALNAVDSNTFELTGDFSLEQLPLLVLEGEELISSQAGKALKIDLSQWEHAKSTVLSLLLTWLRSAKKNQVSLQYINAPKALIGLAQVSGLDTILFAQA